MPQGKTLHPSELRAICTDHLTGSSYSRICQKRKVSTSTLYAVVSALKINAIGTVAELWAIDDARLMQIVYGENCDLNDKYVSISRKSPQKAADPNTLQVDFQALVRRFSDNSSLTKEDLYRDHVLQARAQKLKSMARTTFLRRFREAICAHRGPNVYMHREHAFGDALQIDWCGTSFPITIDEKGTVRHCPVIVVAWPASYYVYAEIVSDLTTVNTIHALRRALIQFGCLPNRFVIDNAKSMVNKHQTGREAIFNASFEFFASQCGIQIDANNPYSPNEKSCVETSVRLVQQRVLSRMDTSLPRFMDEANRELMEKVKLYINDADFRGGGDEDTRAILFLKHEKPAAREIDIALPDYIEHFPFLTVGPDYCVEIDKALYSVPYTYAGKTVSADICNNLVRIFNKSGQEIAAHPQVPQGKRSILTAHMPENHKVVKERELKYKTPDDIINEAASYSVVLASFCGAILAKGSFTEKKKGCIAILNAYKRHPLEHPMLNEAVSRCLHFLPEPKLSSYAVMDEFKELSDFAQKHGGHFPRQQELSFTQSSPTGSENKGKDSSFLRGNDELLGDLDFCLEKLNSNKE